MSQTQIMQALTKANAIRSARAAFKHSLSDNPGDLIAAVLDPPDYLANARVEEILQALPRFGPTRVRGLINRCSFSETRTMDDLTERQRYELVNALRAHWVLGA